MTRKQIHYCIPTYKSFDHAFDGILAAMRGTVPPDKIVVIDNSGDGSGTRYLQPLTEKWDNVYILPQTFNLGVAASWNLFFKTITDGHIIIANDDVMVDPYTIELLVEAAETQTDKIFFSGDGTSGNAFSLFLLTQEGYELIGAFDEAFYPAYYEDNDYARRMALKGFYVVPVHGATYFHVGSSTMKKYTQTEMDAHHNAFRANQAYYIRKWGGMPYQEVFIRAFDK